MLENALIYYIDDLLPNLKLVKALLNSYGYKNVVVIDDPCKVLDLYKANRPDLILLDVNMPVMDGYQVLGQLRGLNDPLLPPIVMMTANDGLEHREKALSAGARD
jgi:putative two-component system response regulator